VCDHGLRVIPHQKVRVTLVAKARQIERDLLIGAVMMTSTTRSGARLAT